ncbi:MAG: PhoH family protein [Phycisphaerae bacterium]
MEITIPIEDPGQRVAIYGNADRNLRMIRSACDVKISARDASVRISGPDEGVKQAVQILEEIQRMVRTSPDVSEQQVEDLIQKTRGSNGQLAAADLVDVFLPSAVIKPKGEGQAEYINAILEKDLTFCVGPAGTGKTYLAAAVSASLLRQHQIKRIVLVRPAVEAGEKLGYLPGDLQAKVNPYLRPLFDAMHDMMSFDQLKRFMANDIIEVVPLAFMRGRTLNNAAIILDEAQNATIPQMLMFLTRLGHGSKMVVTGDASQSDLSQGTGSGFIDALRRLEGVDGVAVVRLTNQDIVRHPLVQRVVERYGEPEQNAR